MTNEQKNVPELRFPGFEDSWFLQKLEKFSSVQMGQSPKSTNYTKNPNEMTLVQGNADLKKGRIFSRIYTSEITQVADIGDIILTVRAPVGELAIAQKKACIGRGVCTIKGNTFIYYLLQNLKKRNIWSRLSQGSTFDSISGKDIRNLNISLPSDIEQKKIGSFFSKLDQQIELEEQKLEKLEQQKKAIYKRFSLKN